jgi:hypothetical protein
MTALDPILGIRGPFGRSWNRTFLNYPFRQLSALNVAVQLCQPLYQNQPFVHVVDGSRRRSWNGVLVSKNRTSGSFMMKLKCLRFQ